MLNFKNDIQEISQNLHNSIEKSIDDLIKKRDTLGKQLNKILTDKLEIHEK